MMHNLRLYTTSLHVVTFLVYNLRLHHVTPCSDIVCCKPIENILKEFYHIALRIQFIEAHISI